MDGSAQPLTILNYAELATFLCVEADRPDRGPISLRAGQHGAVKDSVAEVGLAKICMAEISTMQIRPLKRGPAEVNPGQVCMIEVGPAQVRRRQVAALQPYADQYRAGQVGVPGTLIPLRRASRSAMLRRSTRDSEMTGSSRDGGRRPRTPMAAWISAARTLIQGGCSSAVAVGCSGPPGAPTGQGAWMRADLTRA